MKDRYTDAIQNRFTAYLQAQLQTEKQAIMGKEIESLQRRLCSRIRAIKVIWILKSSITITRWNSRHLS